MSGKIHIRDVSSLEELNNLIVHTSNSMANIEAGVSSYLNGVMQALDKQLHIIRQKLDEAKRRLDNAQKALSACKESQTKDEETGEITPSCDCEERDVASAQREVNEWSDKLNAGERIMGECKMEIDEYNDPGVAISPPGGHYLIENMCQYQTTSATEQLQDFIRLAYDYLEADLSGDTNVEPGSYNPYITEEDLPRTDEEKSKSFKSNIQDIKDEQEADSRYYDIQDANREMCCPCCGRPPQLCTCNNLLVDANLYQ